jgi:hypothetical protein
MRQCSSINSCARSFSFVNSGKANGLERVSKIKAVPLVLCALGLAACASQVSKSPSPPAARNRIVLEPSDDAYKGAMKSLTPAEQKILKKGLGFTIDTLIAAPTPIENMPWSRKRPDTPSVVNISDFVRFLDLQPALGGGTRVNLATAKVLAGLTYEQGTFDPVFRILMEVEPANASVVNVSALGAGPQCSRPADEFPPASAKFAQSEQIAFMKAFLRTLLKINDQLQQG